MSNKAPCPKKLRDVYNLIEAGWTQHCYAKDASGHITEIDSAEAVCFCMSGAIRRATGDVDYVFSPEYRAIETAVRRLKGDSIPDWNDKRRRTKDEVLALVGGVIVEAEQAGGAHA